MHGTLIVVFIQMFSNVVMGLDGDLFENAINLMKRSRGVETDTDLSAEDLQELVAEFKKIFSENVDAAEYPSLVVDGAVQFPQSLMSSFSLLLKRYLAAGIILALFSTASRTRSPMIWVLP